MKIVEKLRNVSGIYSIRNIINGKIYIGSSKNLHLRFWEHRHNLRNNKHCNNYLQNAYNKYKEENFEFKILELCDINVLENREQYWFDISKPFNNTYNLRPVCTNSNIGIKQSKETIEKRVSQLRNRTYSEESLNNMKIGRIGITFSKEHKLNMSKAKSNIPNINKRVKIIQIDKNDNFVKEWVGIREAAKELNTVTSNITSCLKGTTKSAKGYKWKYKETV